MKISTRSRYGLRFLFDLASQHEGEPVFLKDIARRQDLSEKYLSKLVIPLKAAGLIRASRGSHGGYMLARDPEQISVYEIVKILEGDIAPTECVTAPSSCRRSGFCPTRQVWKGLAQAVEQYLRKITLSEIVREGRNTLVSYEI